MSWNDTRIPADTGRADTSVGTHGEVRAIEDDDDVADPAPFSARTRHWYERLSLVVSRYDLVPDPTDARFTQFDQPDALYTRRCTRNLITGRALVTFCDHDTVCASSECRDQSTPVGVFGLSVEVVTDRVLDHEPHPALFRARTRTV